MSAEGGCSARFSAAAQKLPPLFERTDTRTLDSFVHAVVSSEAALVATDEHSGYRHLGRTYKHRVVCHSRGEYRTGDCHTNGIEGFWALLKRQIIGIHHFRDSAALERILAEVTWRFNLRDIGEGCYLSPSNVMRYLDKLAARGLPFPRDAQSRGTIQAVRTRPRMARRSRVSHWAELI